MTFDEMERRVAESRRQSIDRLDHTQWNRVTVFVRNYLGDDFSAFCDLCALANERPNDPFMLRYVDDFERPKLLAQVRRLLAEHRAVMEREVF